MEHMAHRRRHTNLPPASVRPLWLPMPAVLAVATIITLAVHALDAATAGYGWDPVTNETVYCWDLPPLYASYRVLAAASIIWLTAPISFLMRIGRELPLARQQLLICHGTSERRLMGAIMRDALLHAGAYWLAINLIVIVLMHALCHGGYDAPSIEALAQATAWTVDPTCALPSCMMLCTSTVITPVVETCLSTALYLFFGRRTLAMLAPLALYCLNVYGVGSVFATAAAAFPAIEPVRFVLADAIGPCTGATPLAYPFPELLASLAHLVAIAGVYLALCRFSIVHLDRAAVRRRIRKKVPHAA